ncbi:MAG TPA: transglutaminase domain-containing protein [Acidimicrobiales bacterium]
MSIADIERKAGEHLEEEAGHVEADLDAAADAASDEEELEQEPERSSIRLAVAVALPTIAAGIMVGGIFSGASARIYAIVAGILGVVLATFVARVKSTATTYVLIVAGLFAIAVAMVVPSGVDSITRFGKLAADAAGARGVLRPPVPLSPGWQFIMGAILGFIGFSAAWVAIVVKKPALGLLLPLPVAAIAGISVPKAAQVPSGIAALALFALGLGIVSTATIVNEESERPPLSYELRRAGKGLVFVVAITIVLALLAQANVLFPKPIIDPTQEPQKPKTVPLSEVPDRVLFTVKADFSTQWRSGVLDVYQDDAWRTPPFASTRFEDIPESGIVNDTGREDAVAAQFTTAGLTGAVLPVLPGTQKVQYRGPQINFDERSQTLRMVNGQVLPGLTYLTTAPRFPNIDQLRNDNGPIPDEIEEFLEVPSPSVGAQDLLRQALAAGPDKWTQFTFLRDWVYDNITVTGLGVPVDLPVERVDAILDEKKATPYEMVATLGLLSRWIGVPSRLGFGYDKCELVGEAQECRPKNGATFVEVYFPSYQWLPIVRNPKKAQPTVGSKPNEQRQEADVEPNNELAIKLFVPVVTQPPSVLGKQILVGILVAVALLLLAYLAYLVWPLLKKARMRNARRQAALQWGPRARIALAYVEWRDSATDFGYRNPGDTPLMFLDRFADDDEHTELAWLVTRTLWGDLQHGIGVEMALAAEELSRSLRRRMGAAHPGTVRAIAAVSRLSMRHPYAPELDELLLGSRAAHEEEDRREAVPVHA